MNTFAVFFTRRFWIGFTILALIHGAILYAFRNADMSWLLPHPKPVVTAPQWPRDLPPFSSGIASDGTPYLVLPTHQLTADDLQKWAEWNRQHPAQKVTQTNALVSPAKSAGR